MRTLRLCFGFILISILCGCAHQINMTADVSKLEPPASGQIIPKSVGYYFVESRDKIVETAGGGGDKVKYLSLIHISEPTR